MAILLIIAGVILGLITGFGFLATALIFFGVGYLANAVVVYLRMRSALKAYNSAFTEMFDELFAADEVRQ